MHYGPEPPTNRFTFSFKYEFEKLFTLDLYNVVYVNLQNLHKFFNANAKLPRSRLIPIKHGKLC